MKKLISIIIILLSSLCFSQSTSVTIQVTDTPDNQQWINGSWSVQLLPLTGNINNTIFKIFPSGNPVPNINQSGLLNSSGSATFNLTPTTIINPVGIQWTFTVCPLASSPCYSQNYIIFGATQNITITPPSVRLGNPNIIISKAYKDTEVAIAPGTFWLDTVINNLKFIDALGAIRIVGSGGGFTSPMTTLGDIIVENSVPTPDRLGAPVTPNGIASTLTSVPSGGVGQLPAWLLPGINGR